MKNFQILSYNEFVSVVVASDAKVFEPYIFRAGIIYDPRNEYRPVDAPSRTKSLSSIYYDGCDTLIAEAEKVWKPAEEQKVVIKEVEVVKEVEKTPTTPQGTLDTLIAQAVATLSVGSVMEKVTPMLKQYIADTFGVLPKSIEVTTPKGTNKVEGQTHYEFEKILKLVNADIPVFLTGPAGSGKNVICKQVADAMGLQFYFSNSVTQEYKLTGFVDANGHYHETQFYKAFTQGGVFMLDEIDASSPEVLVILNAAIANRYFEFPNGRVDAHEDFRIVAAGNTYGTGADMEYTGRYQLDASSLDRFCIVEIDYDKDIENAIAGGDKELLEFVHDFRRVVKESDLRFTISYRAIDRLNKLKSIFDLQEAIKLAILRGLSNDDAQLIARNLRVKNSFAKAFKEYVAA